MISTNRNRKNKKIIFSPKFFTFAALVVIIALSIPLGKNLSKRRSADKEIAEMQKEIETVENKNQDLTKLISYFQTDSFVEEQARLNLNLKKQGEKVIVIKDISSSSRQDLMGELANARPNYLKWKDYFFNKN